MLFYKLCCKSSAYFISLMVEQIAWRIRLRSSLNETIIFAFKIMKKRPLYFHQKHVHNLPNAGDTMTLFCKYKLLNVIQCSDTKFPDTGYMEQRDGDKTHNGIDTRFFYKQTDVKDLTSSGMINNYVISMTECIQLWMPHSRNLPCNAQNWY